jgi:hypothetical protein
VNPPKPVSLVGTVVELAQGTVFGRNPRFSTVDSLRGR